MEGNVGRRLAADQPLGRDVAPDGEHAAIHRLMGESGFLLIGFPDIVNPTKQNSIGHPDCCMSRRQEHLRGLILKK